MRLLRTFLMVLPLPVLAACSNGMPFAKPEKPAPVRIAPPALPESTPDAPAPKAPKGALGVTVASLGDVSEAGMWLKTPLVTKEQKGRVRSAETGKTARVTLLPAGGEKSGGSYVSLDVMRALGLPLTALAQLVVTPD